MSTMKIKAITQGIFFCGEDELPNNSKHICVSLPQATLVCHVRAASQATGGSTTPSLAGNVASVTVMATWTPVTLTLGPVGWVAPDGSLAFVLLPVN